MAIDLRRLDRRTAVVLALVGAVVILGALGIGFAARVAALRAQRATGPNWSFPSRVFSDGVPLVAGRTAPAPYLLAELTARGYAEVRGQPIQPATYARIPDGFDIVLRGFSDEFDPDGGGGPERVRVHLAEGRIAAVERLGGIAGAPAADAHHEPRLEPALVSMLFDDERTWRTYVSLARVPKPVQDAIVTAEDRRFYGHAGIDPRGVFRALRVDVKEGGVRQGGSTITQQLARGLFVGRERTLSRKLAEIPLALGLELVLSKDEILEMYLNSVYWGQAGSYAIGGIEQASRWYFDAPVESLGVLEGATLAAMIPAPNSFDPFQRPERVLEKRNLVLRAMEETHKLPPGEAARLAALSLDVRRGQTPTERFPSYSSYLNEVLDHTLHHHAATHYGLSVYTTMDLAWQGEAEAAIESGLARMDGGSHRDPLQGAFVALEPSRCRVVAMVGGRSAAPGSYNRAWQAERQTGSAIKPIVYAAAYASPMALTPATTVADTPRTFGRGRFAWTPHNFDGVYHPEVTLAKAMERSLNVATTNVVDWIGPRQVVDVAERFGLRGLKPVASVGLGSNEVGLIELVNAYAAFQNDGMLRQPSPLRVVVDRNGRKVAEPSDAASEAIPPAVASLMTALLQNVVRYGVASPLVSTYGFDRPVAGKTGTTNDFKDAWFVAFTPDIVAGTWVGYDRPKSIGLQAAHSALPLWAGAVGRMLEGFPPRAFAANADVTWADMDPWTGCLADSAAIAESTPFIRGTEPVSTCTDDSLAYRYASYDSIYSAEDRDSAWIVAPDTAGVRDTVFEEPSAAPEGVPPAEPDTVRQGDEPR